MFWKSTTVKAARKQHICEYCRKKIKIGETYTREVGVCANEFNHYKLCKRCRRFLSTFNDGEEELGDLQSDLYEYELIVCPECGSRKVGFSLKDNMQKADCKCKICASLWEEELDEQRISDLAKLN